MHEHIMPNTRPTRSIRSGTQWFRGASPLALACGVTALAALVAIPRMVTADEPCNNNTLRGDYGILVTGVRAVGPTATESFVGTALRRYDGAGRFAQVDNTHGQVRGATRDQPASGRYDIGPNCSGTSTIFFPGAPPVETAFVVVDNGKEVLDAVMTPQPNMVTAIARRVR